MTIMSLLFQGGTQSNLTISNYLCQSTIIVEQCKKKCFICHDTHHTHRANIRTKGSVLTLNETSD